jgi:probable HAF family extracellular repeat protein
MWFTSLLRGLIPRSAGAGGFRYWSARRKPAARRLHLESLEDRWCPSYSITDLGTLGGAGSYAYAINNANPVQVVGEADTTSGFGHAFLYSSGVMTDLGTLTGDTWSKATALNKSGQVVGISVNGGDPGGIIHAFIWQSGGMTDLGNLGSSNTHARAINGTGQVVGDGNTAAGVDHAWLWQSSTGMTDLNSMLPPNSGWVLSQAWGINEQQQIVGQGTINGQTHAFLWQVGGGVPTDLGALPGTNTSSFGTAINPNGQVAGISSTAAGPNNGSLWTSPGPMTDLPPLHKDVFSYAYALNDLSPLQVVGYSQDAGIDFHAVLWQNGRVTDLTSQLPRGSGWTLEHAYGINHNGWIVGEGANGSGRHAFLLTPTTTTSAAVPALTSPATVSSFSIPLSSAVAAPAPLLVSAVAPGSGLASGQKQTPASFVATRDPGLPRTLSKGRTIAPESLVLKARDRVFSVFADDLVSAPS